MNVFYTSASPEEAARNLCDKHVGKMLIESAQLLATANHLRGHPVTYKPTHVNHPSAVWTRSSPLHYAWVLYHAQALVYEFDLRYDKRHKTGQYVFGELALDFPGTPTWSDPPQCMPDEFKGAFTIDAYRRYYKSKEKVMQMEWRKARPQPWWFDGVAV